MLSSLRSRLGRRGEPAAADPDELRARIDELTDANREHRAPERERELLRLRHRAGAILIANDHPAPEDRTRAFTGTDEGGLAAVNPAELDGGLVRGGILEHGYVLVRGLVDRTSAVALAERIEQAFEAREAGGGRNGADGLYEEFVPDPPYGSIAGRSWVGAGGGIMAADSPALAFELLELLERSGLNPVIADFLDSPVTISVEKCTLRKADPGPSGGWHQDGSFMGRTRALNVWVSLSDCGVDAPGLDIVPRRIEDLLDTGGIGSGVEHFSPDDEDAKPLTSTLIGSETANQAAGDVGVIRPSFEPGDAMLFDDRFLHRTGSEPEMPNPRYAIESWFFAASGFPRDYVPLAV